MNNDNQSYGKDEILSAVYKRLNGSTACFASTYDRENGMIAFGISEPLPYRGMLKNTDNGVLMVADYRTKKIPEDRILDVIDVLNKKNSEMIRGKFDIDEDGNLHFEHFITMYSGQRMNLEDFMIEFLLAGRMMVSVRGDVDGLLDKMEGEFRIKEE